MEGQRINAINALREVVVYGLFNGGGFGLREAREEAANVGLLVPPAMDEEILESVLVDSLAESLFADDDNQPLYRWWWHLGKIRDKTYPAELLPDTLQTIYQNTKSM